MKTRQRRKALDQALAAEAYLNLDNGTRVFHSERVYNEGEPATPGWYWEWADRPGIWHGPFLLQLDAITASGGQK